VAARQGSGKKLEAALGNHFILSWWPQGISLAQRRGQGTRPSRRVAADAALQVFDDSRPINLAWAYLWSQMIFSPIRIHDANRARFGGASIAALL
jgi:hypothetical protein